MKLRLLAVAIVALCGARVEGGNVVLRSDFGAVTAPDVSLLHVAGGTEGYNASQDLLYGSRLPPAIDFYSVIPGYNLIADARGLDSTSTFHTKMTANGVTANGTLGYSMASAGDFGGLNIYSDIYDKNGSLVLGDIDVRQYVQNSTTIPLSLNDGDFYSIDVRFAPVPEPSTFALLGIGAVFALGLRQWRQASIECHRRPLDTRHRPLRSASTTQR